VRAYQSSNVAKRRNPFLFELKLLKSLVRGPVDVGVAISIFYMDRVHDDDVDGQVKYAKDIYNVHVMLLRTFEQKTHF